MIDGQDMIAKTWCREFLTALKDNAGYCNFYRQLSVSNWFNARDHIGGDELQQQQATGWSPKKRLTRYQMDYLRTLRSESPELWTPRRLSKYFGISYISVVKILKSNFHPSEEVAERQDARAIKLREQRKRMVKKRISALHKANYKSEEIGNTSGMDKSDK